MNTDSTKKFIGAFLSLLLFFVYVDIISPSIVMADDVKFDIVFKQDDIGTCMIVKNISTFPVNIQVINLKMNDSQLSKQIGIFSSLTPGKSLKTYLFGAKYENIIGITINTNKGDFVTKDIPMLQ